MIKNIKCQKQNRLQNLKLKSKNQKKIKCRKVQKRKILMKVPQPANKKKYL